jgi:HK97 family phage major capsid protein
MKDKALRDRLKAVQDKKEEVREDRATALKEKEKAKEEFGKAELTPEAIKESDEFKNAQEATAKVGKLDDELSALGEVEQELLGMLGEDKPGFTIGANGNGPSDVVDQPVGGLAGNVDRLLGEGSVYAQLAEAKAFNSKGRLGSHTLGELAGRTEVRDFMSASAGGPMAAEVDSAGKLGAMPADRRGIIVPNLTRLALLDLFPSGTTDANVVEFVQVTAIPTAAKGVAEGALKPEASFTTKDADAPARTIAAFIKMRKQALADVAGLGSIIGTLLPYDVRRKLELELLVGDGEDQELTGILNTPGIGAPEAEPGDNRADTILRAMTVVYLADGEPTFVALHPLDWQALLLMRENEKDRTGAYLYGTPSMPVAPTIWGLAITNNRVVPQDEPLVGDSMAAMVLYREGLQVLASDSDQDDFVKNRVTLLAELRAAFPVWRPSSFAVAPKVPVEEAVEP